MKKTHSEIVQEMARFASSKSIPREALVEPMVAALEWLVIFGYLNPQTIESWPADGLVIEGEMPVAKVV